MDTTAESMVCFSLTLGNPGSSFGIAQINLATIVSYTSCSNLVLRIFFAHVKIKQKCKIEGGERWQEVSMMLRAIMNAVDPFCLQCFHYFSKANCVLRDIPQYFEQNSCREDRCDGALADIACPTQSVLPTHLVGISARPC